MMKQILIPTDGSPLSDRALPLAETLARAQQAEIVLARVVEPPIWYGFDPSGIAAGQVYEDLLVAVEHDAVQRLDGLVGRLQAEGLRARGELLHGPIASALLDFEKDIQPDLVVMGTHGRTGLPRFALGSIADLMVREGSAPVLLVRSLSPALSAADTALVPLDGSAVAEKALTMVKELAGKPIRRVLLLRAIEAPEDWDGASRYLEGIARGLAGLGLEVTTSVRVEEPAAAIMRTAPRAHLVILSTHGRGGVDRLRHGSVANRIVHQGTIPTLLVRVHAVEAAALSPSLPIAVEFV